MEPTMEPTKEPSLAPLRQEITRRFGLDELRALCLDLDVDYDSLPGDGKTGKVVGLVDHMRRQCRIPELTAALATALATEATRPQPADPPPASTVIQQTAGDGAFQIGQARDVKVQRS